MMKPITMVRQLFTISILLACFCCSCSIKKEEPLTVTDFKLNTIVTITLYDSKEASLLDGSLALCDKYELLFSRTNKDSELYQLNHHQLETDSEGYSLVSPELYSLILSGMKYSTDSDNHFDIAIEPLTALWDFSSKTPSVPDEESINQALMHLNHNNIQLKAPNKVKFVDAHMGIDLGGIAKGYIADQIALYLKSNGVNSAIISLGGNLVCLGSKENNDFTIGIQKPFAPHGEYIATLDIKDKSVVSSGTYERYFEKNGILYHHILNPQTGYPYQNDLIGVTIITNHSIDADALSTTCFSLGLKDGLSYINSIPDAEAIFITSDDKLHYSDHLQSLYHPVAFH